MTILLPFLMLVFTRLCMMDVGTVIQGVVAILCYNFVLNVDDRRALEMWVSTYIK